MKIAFLHALPFDGRMWEPQLDDFAGHDVHAPALYDLGDSIDEWALGVLQVVPGRFVAVGASMGGYTAAAIARPAPERLQGIVMAGSRADADPPERAPLREEWIRIARAEGGEGLWNEVARKFFADGTPEEIVERGHEIAAGQEPEALARAIIAIRDRSDSTEAVTGGPPLLVVGGDADPMIQPEVWEGLAAASPNGRAEILERCGHVPSMERPDEFNRILRTFLAAL